ncbi:hypothetical protein, partial [Romboutsia sp.]|uniref:hypothetical protein n=1 Tax=Romboutsia sp. TaxID=1965302 RepID=UPI003F2B48E1
QSGFKAYVNSFYELTKNYLAFCNMEFNISIKSKDFIEYVTQCEESGLLPQDGALFCNALRMLRNEHAHGYERPTFEDVLEFYKENSHMFLAMINISKNKLEEISDK